MSPPVEVTPTHIVYCFYSLLQFLQLHPQQGITSSPALQQNNLLRPASEFYDTSLSSPFFITWLKDDELRGCIGTLQPSSHAQLGQYALKSALQDQRFQPIEFKELPLLSCKVSMLHSYEDGKEWDDWEIGRHGIVMQYKDFHATFLPEVAKEQGWTHRQTLKHLLRKSGYDGTVDSVVLAHVLVTRYQSSNCVITYQEYQQYMANAIQDKES